MICGHTWSPLAHFTVSAVAAVAALQAAQSVVCAGPFPHKTSLQHSNDKWRLAAACLRRFCGGASAIESQSILGHEHDYGCTDQFLDSGGLKKHENHATLLPPLGLLPLQMCLNLLLSITMEIYIFKCLDTLEIFISSVPIQRLHSVRVWPFAKASLK